MSSRQGNAREVVLVVVLGVVVVVFVVVVVVTVVVVVRFVVKAGEVDVRGCGAAGFRGYGGGCGDGGCGGGGW